MHSASARGANVSHNVQRRLLGSPWVGVQGRRQPRRCEAPVAAWGALGCWVTWGVTLQASEISCIRCRWDQECARTPGGSATSSSWRSTGCRGQEPLLPQPVPRRAGLAPLPPPRCPLPQAPESRAFDGKGLCKRGTYLGYKGRGREAQGPPPQVREQEEISPRPSEVSLGQDTAAASGPVSLALRGASHLRKLLGPQARNGPGAATPKRMGGVKSQLPSLGAVLSAQQGSAEGLRRVSPSPPPCSRDLSGLSSSLLWPHCAPGSQRPNNLSRVLASDSVGGEARPTATSS